MSFWDDIKGRIYFPLFFNLALIGIHFVKNTMGRLFPVRGIIPRTEEGLFGIVTGPLIHGDWAHVLGNVSALLPVMLVLWAFYKRISFPVFIIIYVLTGISVWLFAGMGNHIGASGVLYGLVSFLFWMGVFRRNLKSIVIALFILMYFSSMFYGILPTQIGVSWESHLFGGIVGIIVAFAFRNMTEFQDETVERPKIIRGERTRKLFADDTFEDKYDHYRDKFNPSPDYWNKDTFER